MQALASLKKEGVQILATDYDMPELSGIELIKEAKRISPSIGCIVFTGKGTIEVAVEAMKSGAQDFFEKPLNLKLFVEKLARLLETTQQIGEVEDIRMAKDVMEENAALSMNNLLKELEKMEEAMKHIEHILNKDDSAENRISEIEAYIAKRRTKA